MEATGFRVGPSRYKEVYSYMVEISRAIKNYLSNEMRGISELSREKALDVADGVEKALIIADRTGGKGLAFAENIATLYRIALMTLAEEGGRVSLDTLLDAVHGIVEDYAKSVIRELGGICSQLKGSVALYVDRSVGAECLRARREEEVIVIDDRPFNLLREAVKSGKRRVKVYPYVASKQALESAEYLIVELLSLSARYGVAKSGARSLMNLAGDIGAKLAVVVPGLSVRSITSHYSLKMLPRYQVMMEWMEYVYFPLYDVVDASRASLIYTEGVKLEELNIAGLESIWRSTLSRLLEEALARYLRSV